LSVFVDTGAWIALLDPRDEFHSQARRYFQAIAVRERLITTNYVIQETVTRFVYDDRRAAAYQLRDMVAAGAALGRVSLVWITPELDSAAWEVFHQYDDQSFSFVDCSSIVVSRNTRVDSVFSFDNDFRIAGFDTQPRV
jgi:predicted nucleic acid-binding protein